MIEVMNFKLAKTQSKAAFDAVNHRVQTEYAPLQPGLISRTTGRNPDGTYIVIMEWRSDKDQEAASHTWGNDSATTDFGNAIDDATSETKYYATPDGVFGSL